MLNKSNQTAKKIARKIRNREITAVNIAEQTLARIRELNPELNAVINISEDLALRQAEAVDKDIKSGKTLPPFAGVPILIKDNINIKGIPCTCGSKILKGYIPLYDAGVIGRIKNSRLIIVGTTNMDEFAMGSSNETSAYKPVKNPYSPKRVPGGSSGGSAAAVASGMVPFALGSDTGGSVRQPAAFCGVVGMRPTYGLVSRYGLVAFSSSMDQIGPITENVEDNAALLGIIAGFDEKDSTSINKEVPDYIDYLQKPLKGKKVGLPREYFGDGLNPEIRESIENSIEALKDRGVEFEEISLPNSMKCIADYYVIANAEASSNLARYDGIKYGLSIRSGDLRNSYIKTRTEGFGTEVKRRIMLGTYVLSAGYYDAYYRRAQKVRTIIRNEFIRAFADYDLIITPTTPTVAFKFGEKLDNPLQMYLSDIYTASVTLAGLPAIAIPCGFNSEGLPMSIQMIAPPLMEKLLYNFAYILETKLDGNGG